MKRFRFGLLLVAAVSLLVVLAGGAGARPPLPDAGMAKKRTVTPDVAGYAKQHGPHSQFDCIATSGGANTKLDCDDPYPNNEPDIEVDPQDPGHMVASSNDYGSCCDQFYTSKDAAATWTTGNMSKKNPQQTGSDPVTVFDRKHGTVIHSSLNYSFQLPTGEACRGDVTVSVSTDGGITWQPATVVDSGVGCDLSNSQLFNDKEWIVTDNNPSSPHYGRTYLTWTKFVSASGAYQSSPIYESHSDDGGKHWTKAQEISGSNAALCTYQETGPAGQCDENQFSVPTIGPDGTVYVAFENEQNLTLWDESAGNYFVNQYLLVKSTDGGVTWSSPTFVVGLVDGTADYPTNVSGRQTLTGYQVRVNSAGNIVAGPTAGTLYLVFSDNRNGTPASTNTDVFLMVSTDGGASWDEWTVDSAGGDQWFPWVDVNPTDGSIGILYNDRGSSNGALYNVSIAEGTPGSLTKTAVSTAPSHPTQSRYFRAGVSGCENCATFHGDYIGLSYGSDGKANMAWTDMRDESDMAGLYYQFIYYAQR
jgi:hypothetical protein